MADQKLTDLPAIATGDIDNSVLLYCVDVTGGNISSKVTRSALYLDIANTFTKGQTISPVTITGLTLNPPTTPVGSASVIFIGGISITTGTIAFATTAQSTDYGTVRINQSTLVNSPGSGTIPNAWSLKIDGPPIASTNVTISNNYAFWVASGGTYLQGTLTLNNGSSPLVIYNPAGSFTYTITPAAIAANRILNLPLITATDTLASLGLAQTFSTLQTFSAGITVSSGTATFASTTTTPVTITYPSAPAGSSSVFYGGIKTAQTTIGFVTTAQTNDYYTTYFDSAVLTNPSSGTIPNAATLKIVGAPIASTNVTITNNYALWVAAGTSKFDGAVTMTADSSIATTKKFGFNAGLTNYIYESATNVMSFATSSTEYFRVGSTGGIGIISGQKFNLDGVSLAGDTYILESSANVFDLFVGGTNTLRSTATAVTSKVDTITGTGGNTFLYINGNNNTLYPLSATGVGAIGWNFQTSAIDFWNTFTSATDSFVFRQLTGASSQTTLMTLSSGGLITRYGTIATAGIGLVPVYASTKQKSETGADTNVLTYTPPAVAGTYLVNIAITKVGTAAPALTFSAAANDAYECDCPIEIDNSATNIVVKTTFSGTSIAYKISAAILQLA